MSPRLHRLVGAFAAGPLAGVLVGAVTALGAPPSHRVELAWRLAALLTVPGFGAGAAMLALEALRTADLADNVNDWISLHRKEIAALLVTLPPASAAWVGLASRAGRHFLTAYHHTGLASFAQAVALLALTLVTAAVTAALTRVVRARLPERDGLIRGAFVVGAALGLAVVGHGVFWGDAQGEGGLAALGLGGYGVLKKPELDLAPVTTLLALVAVTAVLSRALRRVGGVALPLTLLLSTALLKQASRHFGEHEVAAAVDARPGVPRIVLRALRRRTDGDRDGYARAFGGGDCDDHNAAVNPGAADLPGNNVDEDCSGRDAPRRVTAPPAPAPVAQRSLRSVTPEGMNLVVITVDTLRWDTHYAGNPNPITPNLDRLAAQSVVWRNAYAISSYTGRAIGPLFTGRYPTECPRDGAHFTRYLPSNVFLAERLRDRGYQCFGAASHFYFRPNYGLAQGMDPWDLSAEPSGGTQETQAADHRVADRALALLRDPQRTSGRFFVWTHFFDPHKQYVDHPELPLFGRGERARYDREVMFSDVQVGRLLDAIDALPPAVRDRTMVLVTADHGEAFGEHGMAWHGVELWDELVRVPLLLRVPGITPRTVNVRRSQIDLLPTLMELLRLVPPAVDAADALSGVSLSGDLLGAEAPARPVYIELPEGPFNSLRRSVIDGDWKLTERGVGRFELYNLANDPGERTNLAATDPESLRRLRDVMESVRGGLHVVRAVER
jgi:choline-sulfatase